ncbi:4168_t:CDS:2 [Acaulospora colombiana]|uniref:4168_t:CDS:1 n=1 Tax=Acaulospora colombiana TaxID=27376 RepID=A0ACA9K033_9GLOM|nr:4168_t:CDS:2 [Acaulospora colombiana]
MISGYWWILGKYERRCLSDPNLEVVHLNPLWNAEGKLGGKSKFIAAWIAPDLNSKGDAFISNDVITVLGIRMYENLYENPSDGGYLIAGDRGMTPAMPEHLLRHRPLSK